MILWTWDCSEIPTINTDSDFRYMQLLEQAASEWHWLITVFWNPGNTAHTGLVGQVIRTVKRLFNQRSAPRWRRGRWRAKS